MSFRCFRFGRSTKLFSCRLVLPSVLLERSSCCQLRRGWFAYFARPTVFAFRLRKQVACFSITFAWEITALYSSMWSSARSWMSSLSDSKCAALEHAAACTNPPPLSVVPMLGWPMRMRSSPSLVQYLSFSSSVICCVRWDANLGDEAYRLSTFPHQRLRTCNLPA